MSKVEIVGPKNKKPSSTITLERTSANPPEFRITDFNLGRELTYEETYCVEELDKHYLLKKRNQSGIKAIYGITHTEREADSRLRKIALEEFERLKQTKTNPSENLKQFCRDLYGRYIPRSYKFVNNLEEKK